MGLDRSDTLAVTAIVISLVALVSTIGQIVQQYLGTSEGFRRCRSSVMGLWGKATRRKFDWGDMREQEGPLPGRAIYMVDGTDLSYHYTGTLPPEMEVTMQSGDGERTSWITLLAMLQRNERESRQWDHEKSRPGGNNGYKNPDYTLCAQIQKKTQSWSFVPAGVVKPYGFTTMSHLIEMVSMLGMHWIAFDQTIGNVIAEGNGMIVTSSLVQGLGLLVSFDIVGKSDFTSFRTIPSEHLKALCFGSIPNVFDGERVASNIKFGSRDETSATLEFLGCDFEAIKRYQQNRHTHIFPVAFEIIGMFGKCIRLRGSSFRQLPNPTTEYWQENVSVITLLHAFRGRMDAIATEELPEYSSEGTTLKQLRSIQLHSQLLSDTLAGTGSDQAINIVHREMIHDAVDSCTEYIQLFFDDIKDFVACHLQKLMEVFDDPNSPLSYIRGARDSAKNPSKESFFMEYYFFEIRPAVIGNLDSKGRPFTKLKKEQRQALWITLIFRMVCWFLLHDFHPMDVKIVPSNLKGSRIPVYIG